MPCYTSDAEREFYEKEYQKKRLKEFGLNTDGTEIDFLTSLLCSHLRYLRKNMTYDDFMRLVQSYVREWFEVHCENERSK